MAPGAPDGARPTPEGFQPSSQDAAIDAYLAAAHREFDVPGA
jgi:hypothetical protein